MRTRTAPGVSAAYNEGGQSGPVAGPDLPVEIVQQDRLEPCGVPDSSNNGTSMPRTCLDGPPTAELGSARF